MLRFCEQQTFISIKGGKMEIFYMKRLGCLHPEIRNELNTETK